MYNLKDCFGKCAYVNGTSKHKPGSGSSEDRICLPQKYVNNLQNECGLSFDLTGYSGEPYRTVFSPGIPVLTIGVGSNGKPKVSAEREHYFEDTDDYTSLLDKEYGYTKGSMCVCDTEDGCNKFAPIDESPKLPSRRNVNSGGKKMHSCTEIITCLFAASVILNFH